MVSPEARRGHGPRAVTAKDRRLAREALTAAAGAARAGLADAERDHAALADDCVLDAADEAERTTRSQGIAERAEHAREELRLADEALGQLDSGDYGTCASCGRPIDRERVLALPLVRHCIDCATAARR
ncbi:TraR/DksA family transcriptional regulator [Streptomyces sp. NPDC088732]|uniref:TraR/DksA family transcriptional regulator n=1 Tax=Streptomyces sp. NPDC088732 TaxID=3365879 RepID=UPI00381F4935